MTQDIAADLRRRILSGEWRAGHVVPSQQELTEQYGVAGSTAWQAVLIVENEGLVEGRPGGRFVVTIREPVHKLVLNPRAIDNRWSAVPTPRPPRFVPGEDAGEVKRTWTIDTVHVPESIAIAVGLEPHEPANTRAMRLTVGGTPVLTSVSYVPPELAKLANQHGWRDVGVAELALTGHEIKESRATAPSRIPTPEEREALDMGRGVPVYVLRQPYRLVLAGREIPAGVVVTARCDLVYLQ